MAFAALARPIITFHPHIDRHAVDAHHAAPIVPEDRQIASILETICLAMDGCHQFGTWHGLDGASLNVPPNRTGCFPGHDSPFTSAFVAGPLRPPDPLAVVPSDEWVRASFREAA